METDCGRGLQSHVSSWRSRRYFQPEAGVVMRIVYLVSRCTLAFLYKHYSQIKLSRETAVGQLAAVPPHYQLTGSDKEKATRSRRVLAPEGIESEISLFTAAEQCEGGQLSSPSGSLVPDS